MVDLLHEGFENITKAEYVRMYPRSAQFCWCCGKNWDECNCGFYESTHRCPKCGHGVECCCVCLTAGGPLSELFDDVTEGRITQEQALERLDRGAEPAVYKQKRQTECATTKDTKGHVIYVMGHGNPE